MTHHVEKSRDDELASHQLARPRSGTTAEIRRPARAGTCGGLFGPIAAARGLLGNRGLAIQAGAGAARRTIPAARRGLRREFRRLRIRQHRAAAEDSVTDEPGASAGPEEAGDPRGALRRTVREATLGRNRNEGWRDVAVLPRG